MSEQPITSVEDAVAALGALPMPSGPEPRDVEDELTGANLSLWEEEQLTIRLRWALASAQRGRRELRAEVAALREERHSTNEALDDAVQALRARRDDGPALPWAAAMSDDDLHGFLGDLVSAAMGRWQHSPEVPDREVLAAVEKACAEWRTPGQGYRSDEDVADGITQRIVPVQALREDEPHDAGQLVEWCTGCNTDHDPDECGYRPESGGAL